MSSRHILYGDAKASATAADSGRKQRALQTAQAQFDTEPNAANRMALANAMFELGRFNEAEQHMSQLLEANNNDPDVMFELGFIYKNLGRKDEAIKVWKLLVESNARHPLARAAENEIWRLDSTYKPSWINGAK